MSIPAGHDFSSVMGIIGNDLRLEIGAKGRMNLLSVVASYNRSANTAHDVPTFYGRLVIVQGILPVTPEITPFTDIRPIANKILFDVMLRDLGPHAFFFPLAQLQGNVQTEEGGILTIVLCQALDNPNGAVFIGRLNCAGQTVFGGTLSGQRGSAL